jgi:hypothetical protein
LKSPVNLLFGDGLVISPELHTHRLQPEHITAGILCARYVKFAACVCQIPKVFFKTDQQYPEGNAKVNSTLCIPHRIFLENYGIKKFYIYFVL